MKKLTLGWLAGLACCASPAVLAADFSVGAGVDYLRTGMHGSLEHQGEDFHSNSRWTGFVDFRHPLLVLPNVNFQSSEMFSQANGLKNDLLVHDLAFYYRPFELGLVNIDVGLDLRRYDGDFNDQHSYSRDQAMLFTGVEAGLPGLPLDAFADARVTQWDGDKSHDWRIGMSWAVNPQDSIQLKLRAGYRNVRMDFDADGIEVNQRTDGWFVGTEFRF